MPLLLVFLLVPLIEIALFVQLGSVLHLGWILGAVVATGILGVTLVRQQGLGVLAEVQGSLSALRDPTEPLANGALILFAGALLLTPGFFTDTVGFLLLVPALRAALIRRLRERIVLNAAGTAPPWPAAASRGPGADTGPIDAEYREVAPDGDAERRRPSGWTQS